MIRGAYADCVETGTIYTSCKPGYYLTANDCIECPDSGTSLDKNTGGITECYIPAQIQMTDDAGTYQYTENCNWTE